MNTFRRIPVAALLLLAAAPLSAQTGLTIYNSGRVLVRRTLPVAVPKGASDQRLSLGLLDPASLFPLDPAVSFLAATYDGGTDQQSTLRRAIGRDLLFVRGPAAADTTTAGSKGRTPNSRFRSSEDNR